MMYVAMGTAGLVLYVFVSGAVARFVHAGEKYECIQCGSDQIGEVGYDWTEYRCRKCRARWMPYVRYFWAFLWPLSIVLWIGWMTLKAAYLPMRKVYKLSSGE